MASGTSFELRCGECHSNSTFPTDQRAPGDVLGELYVSPSRNWMAWSGPYERRDDRERNWLPGPRQLHEAGPGTTWRPVPLRGIEHECAERRHRINVVERDLWEMIRVLPAGRSVLLLPARAPLPAAVRTTPEESHSQPAREVTTRPWPSRRAAGRAASIPR